MSKVHQLRRTDYQLGLSKNIYSFLEGNQFCWAKRFIIIEEDYYYSNHSEAVQAEFLKVSHLKTINLNFILKYLITLLLNNSCSPIIFFI